MFLGCPTKGAPAAGTGVAGGANGVHREAIGFKGLVLTFTKLKMGRAGVGAAGCLGSSRRRLLMGAAMLAASRDQRQPISGLVHTAWPALTRHSRHSPELT